MHREFVQIDGGRLDYARAQLALASDRVGEAVASLEHLLEERASQLPAEDPYVTATQLALAEALFDAGQMPQARELAERARVAMEGTGENRGAHADAVRSWLILARIAAFEGDHEYGNTGNLLL